MQSGHSKNNLDLTMLESFFKEGALVQSSSDSYMLFIGPFQQVHKVNGHEYLLYKPDFWSFLKNAENQLAAFKAEKTIELKKNEFYELLLGFSQVKLLNTLNKIKWNPAEIDHCKEQFQWIQNKINQNELKKGLPIISQTGSGFSKISKVEILINCLLKGSTEFLYGYWSSNSGFIGYTPEVFIDQKNNEVSTMALAGTWSKEFDNNFDFENSKIEFEHNIVVEDMLNQLSDEKLILKSKTEVLELEYLFHLKTELKYKCENIIHFIQKLHPTAALGLYPRSIKLFNEFALFDLQKKRKNFGAPFGFISFQKSFLIVAIRNIFWMKDNVILYSGCGVTRESDFDTECKELEAKRNSVKRTFGFNL